MLYLFNSRDIGVSSVEGIEVNFTEGLGVILSPDTRNISKMQFAGNGIEVRRGFPR